jgi:NAD(P)-dependent dehydrogenase (short-subunit alcohol dehydrogenase family)
VTAPVVVVTGASSGIGKETARVLAKRGLHVGLVCRNPSKGEATVAEIMESAPGATVDLFLGDLSLLSEVKRVADDLHASYDRIDVLINNAGVNLSQHEATVEGFDVMMATNYLAPVLLTRLAGDLVLAAPQGRVVNVASEAHRFAAAIDFDALPDLGDYRGGLQANRAYGLTKLLLILHTQELAHRLATTPVTANSLCPGLVATNLVGAQAMVTRLADVLSRTPLVRSPLQGAQMSIKLATDPAMADVSGEFFTSTSAARILPNVGARADLDLQRELWERTEQWLGR